MVRLSAKFVDETITRGYNSVNSVATARMIVAAVATNAAPPGAGA